MSKDKIVIINHYGVTPDLPGATKHYEMAKYFSDKQEYDIELWMCGFNHYTSKNHPNLNGFKLQSVEENEGFKSVRIKSTPYRNNKVARQLNTMIFDFITFWKILFSKNIKAVIISIPPNDVLNVLATRMRGIKVAMDLEDIWPLFLEDMGLKNKFAIWYLDKSADYFYRVTDKVLAVSQGMVDFAKKKVNNPKNVHLIPLGVNLDDYTNIEHDRKLFRDFSWKNDFKIMYLGAHGRANDISSVLNTIKEFNRIYNEEKNVSFVFIGDGDQKERLIKEKENLNLNNVYFEDAVPGNLVPNYLSGADVCLTNLQKIESFKLVRPNKIFQYMALKKPIISGIWGESKNIVEKSDSGIYVDFTDNEKAAQKIKAFIKNRSDLIEKGQNSFEYIAKEGDRKKIFEKAYQIIKTAIKEN